MSGARYFNFRQGDRSEYLAQYLLSGIGLATPVPRQEDVGIDFHCSIADQQDGLMTFGHAFSLQIKSASSPNVVLGGARDQKWLERELLWYLRQTTPLLLGVVDKTGLTLDLYSTSATRLAFVKTTPAKLTLVPRTNGDLTTHTTFPSGTADSDCTGCGDGKHYVVDLGPPIARLSPTMLGNGSALKDAKDNLRECVAIEQANIVYASLGTPYFRWLLCCPLGHSVQHAWMHSPSTDSGRIQRLVSNLAPPLLSLALSLIRGSRASDAKQLAGALKLLDAALVPDEVKKELGPLLG